MADAFATLYTVVQGLDVTYRVQNTGPDSITAKVSLLSSVGDLLYSPGNITISGYTITSTATVPTSVLSANTKYYLIVEVYQSEGRWSTTDTHQIDTGSTSGGGGTSGGSGSSSVGSSSLSQTAHWGPNSTGSTKECVQKVYDWSSYDYPYYPVGSILYNTSTWWNSCWLKIVCTAIEEDNNYITYTITQSVWGSRYHGFPWHELKITHTDDDNNTLTDIWYKKDISSTIYRNNGEGTDWSWSGASWSDGWYRFTDGWANNVLTLRFKKTSGSSSTRTVTFLLTNPGGTVAMSYGTVNHYPITNQITLTLDVPEKPTAKRGLTWVRVNGEWIIADPYVFSYLEGGEYWMWMNAMPFIGIGE